MVKIGYARVSSKWFRNEVQLSELQRQGCDRVWSDTAIDGDDGANSLEAFLADVSDGDVVVVSRLSAVADSIAEDYEEIEREEISLAEALPNEHTIDFRFYYLDLLIVSRLIIFKAAGRTLILQIQAESRDFDENNLVFSAILKQIRESL